MTNTLPELPALQNDDSMLTRRFGREVINYYAGSRLNRFSFLRPDTTFLRKAAASPTARYLALSDLNALAQGKTELAYLTFDHVKSLIGHEPFHLTEEESIKQYDSTQTSPLIVFLAFLKVQEASGYVVEKNPRAMTLVPEAGAIYAQARSIIDWNSRNTFCAGCGNKNLSVHAGYKRVCPPTDQNGGSEAVTRGDCHTRHGVSNVCFPRTDPTMIAAVVSADGERILLGRQKRWPPHWYSTLAGFLEPGESIEEAVRREVWEESGVRVGRVVIHSSQPWPYPASLMIGAIAQAHPGEAENITLNDKELETAKWFSVDEVRTALVNGVSGLGEDAPAAYIEGDLRLPPPQAIANRLMTAVVEGFLTAAPKI
ncbi:hypothetical protein G7046_g5466 [Stylonectria norvegica]|nr:hypothetical protein G7046_g5466 [Stylonectria norvegica]